MTGSGHSSLTPHPGVSPTEHRDGHRMRKGVVTTQPRKRGPTSRLAARLNVTETVLGVRRRLAHRRAKPRSSRWVLPARCWHRRPVSVFWKHRPCLARAETRAPFEPTASLPSSVLQKREQLCTRACVSDARSPRAGQTHASHPTGPVPGAWRVSSMSCVRESHAGEVCSGRLRFRGGIVKMLSLHFPPLARPPSTRCGDRRSGE